MFNRSGVRTIVGLGAATLSVGLSAGCSSSGKAGGASGSGQVGGSAGSSSVSGSSGSTNSASGTSGTSSGSAQAGTSPPGSGVSSGQASGSVVSSGGSGSSAGSMNASTGSEDAGSQNEPDGEGTSMIDAAGLTPATCAKPTPPPNDTGGAQGSRPGECDYLLQSLDFEDMYSYSTTTANIKTTGVFGLYEINDCSPYCYAKNLTVGIDIVGGGSQAQLQGDVIVEFPATGPGLPITTIDGTNANMRDALAWITFDGAAAPAFEIDTQLVVETSAGVVPAVEVKPFFENKNQRRQQLQLWQWLGVQVLPVYVHQWISERRDERDRDGLSHRRQSDGGPVVARRRVHRSHAHPPASRRRHARRNLSVWSAMTRRR